ncbi:MAG: 5-methylthioadenosine/S-adenosylhomocysteine deaminase [Chloroflexota bacterium]|nr:5-methylthioadenosine/S-adenosylhomocysteine deaminase [Chloroflexota bacterium]
MDAELLLTGGIVLPSASAPPIRDGAVAIADGRIVDMGPSGDVAARVNARRVLDCSGQVVMPGLIDCHIHTCQQMGRGLADDVDVLTWLTRIVALESLMTEDDVNASVRGATLEMIKGGTTGFIEAAGNPLYYDAMGDAIVESGLRAVMTRSTMELKEPDWKAPDPFVMDAETNLRATTDLIERWNGREGGRISAWAGWRQQWNLSDELLVAILRVARENGVGLHGHLSTRRFGQLEHLDRLGVLGPDLVFAHAIKFTARDRALLKNYGVSVVHNVGTSMHCGYGSSVLGCFPEMVAEGINVTLGCDGAAACNTLDMVQQMRLVATLHKEVRSDPSLISPQEAFQMATRNGARAAHWDDVGELKTGNQADIITVDFRQPHMQPAPRALNNVVYCASGQDVLTTIVAGRVLMENRKVLAFDEGSVLAELETRSEALTGRIADRFPGLVPTAAA